MRLIRTVLFSLLVAAVSADDHADHVGGIHTNVSHVGQDDTDHGVTADSAGLEMIFSLADTDGDGMLSLEEATAMGVDKATFNAVDADGNGQLTKAEVETFSMQNQGEAASMLNEDGGGESDGSGSGSGDGDDVRVGIKVASSVRKALNRTFRMCSLCVFSLIFPLLIFFLFSPRLPLKENLRKDGHHCDFGRR